MQQVLPSNLVLEGPCFVHSPVTSPGNIYGEEQRFCHLPESMLCTAQVFLGSVDGCRMEQDMSLLSHWPVLPWELWLPASDNSIDQQGSALLWHYINKPAAETRDCGHRNIYMIRFPLVWNFPHTLFLWAAPPQLSWSNRYILCQGFDILETGGVWVHSNPLHMAHF